MVKDTGEILVESYAHIVLSGIAIALAIVFIMTSKQKHCHWRTNNIPPSPPSIPLIGHLPLIGTKPHVKFTEWSRYYGNIFRIQFGIHPTVVVNDLETIRSIILTPDVEQRKAIAGRPTFPTLKVMNGGYTMTFSSSLDHTWIHKKRWMRQSVTNYTTQNKDTIESNIIARANSLAGKFIAQKIVDPKTDILTTCMVVILDMACHSVQGSEEILQHDKVQKLASYFQQLNEQSISPLSDMYPCLSRIFRYALRRMEEASTVVANLFADILQDNVKTFDRNDLRDLTDHLLKAIHPQVSDDVVLEYAEEKERLGLLSELVGATESTVGTILRWCLMYAAVFPKEQELMHEELQRVVGQGYVRLEHEKRLVRVKAFIAEVKRRSVVLPFLLPHCTVDDTNLGGYDVPKDTIILFNVWSALRDPNHWERPDDFEPQRFINDKGQLRYDRFNSFLHFGAGDRRCIGQRLGQWSVFLLFANILRQCKISTIGSEEYDLDGKTDFTINPKPHRILVEPLSM